MGVASFVMIAVIVVLLAYGIMIYNNLVTLKHAVSKAWANIDVLLKQRHDELPKLVETCKQYMQYEQETLERVMRAQGGRGFGAREGGRRRARPRRVGAPHRAG